MTNKNWYVIGLMSGTSLDGVDLAYIKFTLNQDYTFEILEKESIIYSELWKNRLQEAFGYSGEKLTKLNAAYGKFLGELVLEFIAKNDIQKLDFVASHGHTIFHRPEQGFTLQIGSGAHLSATIKVRELLWCPLEIFYCSKNMIFALILEDLPIYLIRIKRSGWLTIFARSI